MIELEVKSAGIDALAFFMPNGTVKYGYCFARNECVIF